MNTIKLRLMLVVLAGVFLASCSSSGISGGKQARVDDRPLNERGIVFHKDILALSPEGLVNENAALILSSGGVLEGNKTKVDRGLVTFGPVEGFGFSIGSSGEKQKQLGIAASLVKPGAWQISAIGGKNAASGIIINQKGSKIFAALGDVVTVEAGDVVYIGDMIVHIQPASFGKERKIKGLSQNDKFTDAQAWMNANYPKLAPKLEKRLIKCTLCELQARIKQNAS